MVFNFGYKITTKFWIMQEKSADCGKNGTFLVESQKSKAKRTEKGRRERASRIGD